MAEGRGVQVWRAHSDTITLSNFSQPWTQGVGPQGLTIHELVLGLKLQEIHSKLNAQTRQKPCSKHSLEEVTGEVHARTILCMGKVGFEVA